MYIMHIALILSASNSCTDFLTSTEGQGSSVWPRLDIDITLCANIDGINVYI